MNDSDLRKRNKEVLRQMRLDKKSKIEAELPMSLDLYKGLAELLDQNFQAIRYKNNGLTFTVKFLSDKINNLAEVLEWFEIRGGGDDYSILHIIDDELVEIDRLFHYYPTRFSN